MAYEYSDVPPGKGMSVNGPKGVVKPTSSGQLERKLPIRNPKGLGSQTSSGQYEGGNKYDRNRTP